MKFISIVRRKTAAPCALFGPYSDFVVHSFVDASCVAQTQDFFLRLSWIEDAHIRRCPTDKVSKKKDAPEHSPPCEQTFLGGVAQ
jgi:hypothetical protein